MDVNERLKALLGKPPGDAPVKLSVFAHDGPDMDWFQFETMLPGLARHFVRVESNPLLGDVNLVLVDDAGALLGQSTGTGSREQISFEDLPSGRYYVGVHAVAGDTNPDYALTIDAPGGSIAKDPFEVSNASTDRRRTAANLDKIEGLAVLASPYYELSIHDGQDRDWFRFELTEPARTGHYAAIQFEHRWGDLDLKLYDRNGQPVLDPHDPNSPKRKLQSMGARNVEQIDLNGLAAGTYFVEVLGKDSATVNPEYALIVNAPGKDRSEHQGAQQDNNARDRATPLGPVWRLQSWGADGNPLSIDNPNDVDWYSFQLTEYAVEGHFAQIQFSHALGDLTLELEGSSIAQRVSNTARDFEQISLAGLPASDFAGNPIIYYLKVSGAVGPSGVQPTNPAYTLTINAAGAVVDDQWVVEDWAERHSGQSDNDSLQNSYPLGQVRGLLAHSDQSNPLSIHATGDTDWFRFDIIEPPEAVTSWRSPSTMRKETSICSCAMSLVTRYGTPAGSSAKPPPPPTRNESRSAGSMPGRTSSKSPVTTI